MEIGQRSDANRREGISPSFVGSREAIPVSANRGTCPTGRFAVCCASIELRSIFLSRYDQDRRHNRAASGFPPGAAGAIAMTLSEVETAPDVKELSRPQRRVLGT